MEIEYNDLKNIKSKEQNGKQKLITFCNKYNININKKDDIKKIHIIIKKNIDNLKNEQEIQPEIQLLPDNELQQDNDLEFEPIIKTRSNNRQNEKKLLNKICNEINTKKGIYYTKINNQMKTMFDKNIDKALVKGSNSDAFDLIIIFTDGTEKKCEVKESSILPVSNWTNPWEGACQLLNGTQRGFGIILFYAKKWYENNIISEKIKKEFDLKSDIPTFEEWNNKDAKTPYKKNFTNFTSELEKICKIYTSKDKKLKLMKDEFVKNLIIPETIMNEFVIDLNQEIKSKLESKDCFICIYKNEVKLWDKITPPIINKSDIYRNNKLRDVVFKINNSIIKIKEFRIRFQNRIGISNISVKCS